MEREKELHKKGATLASRPITTCMKPGRSVLRRMIELSSVVKELHHHIRLNKGFRSDLQWWVFFLTRWNGCSMMSGAIKSRWNITVTSDASGSWGCGAYMSTGEWFQLRWPPVVGRNKHHRQRTPTDNYGVGNGKAR